MRLLLPAAGLGLVLTASGTARAQVPPYTFTSLTVNNAVRAVDVLGANAPLATDANSCTFLAPRLVVASPDGKYVFVSNGGQSQYVCPIRVSDRKVLPGLWLGGGFFPWDMKVTPDSKYLFIASAFRLIVFDLQGQVLPSGNPTTGGQWTRNEPLNVISGEFNTNSFGVAVAPDMGLFYVATKHFNFATGLEMSRVLAFQNAGSYPTAGPAASLRAAVPAPFAMSTAVFMLFRRDGTRAFLASSGTGWAIDAANDTVLSPGVNFPASISDLQIRPDGNFIYATKGSAAQLFELNSQTLAHVRTINMFQPEFGETQGSFNANGVSFRADSSKAAVALIATNSQIRTFEFSKGIIQRLGTLNGMSANKIAVAEPLAAADTTPPQFTSPLVAGANVGIYLDPTNTVFSFPEANQLVSRVSVQDPESGLSKPTLYAALSTDGGATFAQQTAAFPGPDGSTALEEVNSPSPWAPLNAVQSWGSDPTAAQRRNVIRFKISNKANTASPFFDVPVAVNINPFRTPSLSSPADDAAMSAAAVTLSWAPHPDIPIQAVQSSKLEISAVSDFSTIFQPLDIAAPALTATVSLPPGKYYWRVRMLDKFGPTSYSLNSSGRSFTLDVAPPQLTDGMVAFGGSGLFQNPLSEGVSYPVLQVDARACAQDSLSGLANSTARADYSTDGGATFTQRAPAAVTVSGTSACTASETISVIGVPLVHSISPTQTKNVIKLSISDKAGNPAVPVMMQVTSNLNPIRQPPLSSPADGAGLLTATVQLQWGLDSIVPMGAIEYFTVEVAQTPDFLTGLQSQPITAPGTSATFAAALGRNYWRVRAKDNFKQQSPYSAVRTFFVDTTPPVMSPLESAVSGIGAFQPVSGPITYAPADVRVKVQDAGSGLHAASRQVAWSGDGQLFTALLDSTISGTDGSQAQETLTVTGLNYLHSLSASDARNHLRFRISNKIGTETEQTFPLFVNRNTVTPPLAVAPTLPGTSLVAKTVFFEWTMDTQVPLAAIQKFELQISPDPQFVNGVINRSVNAPGVAHEEALASGSYYWRVRAIDKITPGVPSPYSKTNFFTFKQVTRPSVQIDTPLNGATENDPRSKLQATYDRGSADLDLTTLRLKLDGNQLAPIVDVDYAPAADNGPVNMEQQFAVLASKHQLVASGGYLFLIAGNQHQTEDDYSSRVFRSAVQPGGTLGAWQQTTFGLPVGLRRAGAASNKGFLYVVGGLRQGGIVQKNVHSAHPNPSGNIDSPWVSGPDLLVPAQGVAVAVANRDEDFLYAIGGEGESSGYSDPLPFVQVARIRSDGSLEAWKFTTPLPISLSGASAFEWHGRIYVTGGQTTTKASTLANTFFPSRKTFYAAVDRSGNLGPWTESPVILPVVNASNPLVEYPQKGPELSAPILHKNGQLLFFNGNAVNWASIAADGTLLPWHTSANAFPVPLQFAAAAVSGNYAYVQGGWNGPFDQQAVRRTAFNAGAAQRAVAMFNPASNLAFGTHNINASINDIDGFDGNAAGTFNTASVAPNTVSGDTFGKFTSYETMTMTPRNPGDLPTPVGVALQAGLVIPAGLKIYEMAPHTIFDSPATITLSWPDVDGNGIVDGTTVPESLLQMFKFNGQAWVPVTIVGRDNGNNFIKGELFSASHFALMAMERDPPVISALTPVHGSTLPAGTGTSIAASYSDNTGVLASGVRLNLDETDVTSQARIGPDGTVTYVTGTSLMDGIHSAAINVTDVVGNFSHRGSTFSIDGTRPETTLALSGGRQWPSADAIYTSSDALAAFHAADPLINGASAGVDFTRYQDNAGAFQTYGAPFSLTAGAHSLSYQSQDRVGNLEVLQSTAILVDSSPPQTAVDVGSPSFVDASGNSYVTSGTLIGFSAQDPALPGGQSGSGLDRIEVSIDGGAYEVFTASFSFSGGAHIILYRSVDRVGNTETAKTLSLRSDASPPVTTFQVGAPIFVDVDGTRYVTPTTPVTFSAQDPTGSGVARIEVSVDGAGFTAYGSALTLVEGRHTILFRAVDQLGNVEAAQTLALRSDASTPQTSLALQGGRHASGPDANTFYASTATRFALPALDPLASDVASGLAFTNWQDNGGVFQAYTGTIAFSPGVHQLGYQSQDRVTNLEVLRSTTVRIDGNPPFTISQYDSPNAIISGVRYVTPATHLGFVSVDPIIALPSSVAGSGVDRVMVEIDGAPYAAFTSSLTFAEGRHTVRFRGFDRVENAEIIKTVSPWSDATAPRTTLSLQGGRQAPGPAADTFYASSDTRLALSAVDPLVANVASGLNFIRWQADGGTFQNYAAPIAFTEGAHVFGYQSQDRITNLEVLRSSTVLVDATAPVSTVTVGSPVFVDAGGARFVTPATPVTFSAQDPALPGGTAGSGVDRIEVSVDGSAFSTYSTPLTFAQGLHTVAYRSKDRVGNIEVAQTLTLRSDGAAPLTTLAIQGGKQASGPEAASFFASSDTRLALSATDPIMSGVASGVDFTRWQDNSGALQTYAAPLGFSEGVHLVAYQSQDRVGNAEILRSTTILVDATAPTASLSVGLPRADRDGTRYVSSSTLLTISAEDPNSAGSASGVGSIEKSVDAAPFSAYAGPFSLAEGLRLISARATDRVGNVSPVLSTSVVVDAAAPVFTALAPGAGARFLPSGARLVVVVQAADDHDAAPAISATLVQLEDRGSPRGNRLAVVPVQNGSSFAALDLDDGLWELRAGAIDFVANGTAAVSGPFEVIHDLLPPRTTLTAGTPLALVAGSSVIARGTALTLASVDDLVSLGDALGLGVATQHVSVDGIFRATFTTPMSTFTLAAEADGWHQVAYFATDVLGNVEASRVSTFGIDDTAPETSLAVLGGRQAAGPDALTFYASSGTTFALPAIDRVVNGVASGVDFTRWQDNGGAFTTHTGAFALQEGPHLLAYQSQDRLGKLEVVRSTMVLIDAAAPQSSSAFGTPSLVDTDGTRFVTPATTLSLSAQDPALPGGTAGSGVERIEASVDGAAFSTYTSPLTFAEGRHTVRFRAVDRVGNIETAQTLALRSDASAPQTALVAQGGRQAPGGTGFYASSDTRFALAAIDPLVADVAAGVDFTRWQDNGGALQAYTTPFSLSAGSHLLGFQSQDRVLNLEAPRSSTVFVDATAPVSSYSIGDPLYTGVGAVKYITPATPVTFSAEDATLPGGTPGAGTDRIEVAIDGGAFVAYSAALTFAEGRHTVLFRAVDRVGNVEAAQSLALRSDATAPETSLAVLGGKQVAGTGAATFYASSDTRFALPATDPVVADVASGVDFTTYRDNGGALQPYSGPFTLPAGSHLLSYQSRDVVRNQEVSRTTTVLVDSGAPVSAYSIGEPLYNAPEGIKFITPATPVTFSATDPALPGGAAGSGVERIEVAVDGGAFTAYSSALTFAEGRHTVEFRAVDRVGNVEPAQSLALRSDANSPETSLAVQGGKQVAGPSPATFYASSDTRFALPAADPVAADVAAGVDFTRWQDNGGAFQTYSTPLALAEGSHRLDFQSQDRVANLEALRSTTVYVDATAPISSFSIGDPLYTGVGAVKYVTPATPITFSAEDAALPGGTPGAGTDRIEVAIDGGAFVTYSAVLTFAEGRHTVLFRAIDRVGNVEPAQSLALRSDASAPETALALQGGKQAPGANPGTFYASSDTRFSLPATDPLVADVASGVDFTTYRDNGGAIQPYSGPFALSAGSHLLAYQSRDTVRNQEVSRSTTVLVDSGAPVSSYSIGEPLYNAPGGIKFITPATPVTFSAADSALPGGAAGAGVERIEVAVDGGAFTAYSSALNFAEGRHTVEFRAVDRVGNVEPTQSLALRSDASSPETALAIQGGKQAPAAAASTFYASSDTRFALPAADPLVADVASGVDFTTYRDNGGAIQPYSAPFTLSAGSHLLSYQSRDTVRNQEITRSTTVYVDATPPISAFTIGDPGLLDSDGTRYITPATPVSFTAADPALPGGTAGSGVERIEVAIDGGAFVSYSAALTFAEGRHTVLFRAADQVGNVEASQTLALRSDATAPQTSLAVQGGKQSAGPNSATFYASSGTRFALPASDPIAADVASGVGFTGYRDNGGPEQPYSAAFSLPEGSHLLSYQSRDRVANLETQRSTTVLVDAAAPLSSFAIGTPAFMDLDGIRYIAPATPVSFTAADPALPGGAVGSGVERIEVAVDGGPFAAYSSALTFPEGRHTVQFRAVDRVGNVEAAQSLALRSDASAPMTSLAAQGGRQAKGPDNAAFYASSDTRFALSAFDPLASDVTSGLEFTRWQDSGGAFQTYSAPFALAEGSHHLAYQSQDRVANLEVLRSTTILVDATAPQSSYAIGTPAFVDADGTLYVTPATRITFTAQDPALPGGAAGSAVERIEVAVDGAAFSLYGAALSFAEGRHTVQFRAIDRVGNTEATQSLSLRSDASAPRTSLAVQGGRQVAGPTAESFYASLDTRLSLPAADPTVADVASGVDFTRWRDSGGAFQTYSAPIALTEGSHLLAYQSQDHVSNLEALRSTTVIVDASAPNSAFAIGAPSFMDGDGTRYVTPGTPVSFSASDPGLPGGTAGSGVERIDVAVDGGAFAPYAAALTFAEGRHTVLFRAIDRVGNAEATRSLALRSDASAPQTSLAAVGGRQAAGPDAATFYASGDSRYILPASDPLAADVASGLDFTRWRDGSGAFQTYSAPVALAEGSHLVSYQSQDRVANLEILRSTTVLVDASAPQSAFAIGTPSFVAPDGTRYVTPATPVTFSASDPALPGGTAGSGVDRIEVAVDGAAFTLYSGALTFAEGRHTVQFRALDRVGNSEAPQTLALRSDATPPQTAFSPSAAFYSNSGRNYAPAQFTYTLPASDPLTSDVASGLAETTFGIDAAPRHAYTGAFSLSEGIRTVSFGSRDNVSNLEGERSATVHVDATAPQTSLAVSGGRQAPGPDAASFYASLDTRLSLPTRDPSVAGVASGLDSTSWQDNGGAFQTYGTPIALGAGSHLLSYRSQDHVGNLEVLRSTTVLVDGAAPATAFQIGTPIFIAADGTRYVTPTTPVTFTASDPALAGATAGSGVERIEVSVDGAPFSAYTSALTFAEGRHTIQYRAVDRVGNIEDAGTLALRSDASAPLTSLAAQGGRQVAGPDANSFYASLDTRLALPAADPIVSDVAAGVDITRWQDNGGAFETYTTPLALAEGSHRLAYQSQDKVQNLEILRSTTVLIDATAPLTAFSIGAPAYTDAAGVHYVTPTTPITFTAQDPALPGGTAGSGVDRIEVALDAAGFQTYATALTFGEGRHAIRFRAYDRVGNVEAERTLEVRSDGSAPQSSLAVQGGRQTAGPDATSQYASADTRIVLSASDPLVADVASGVDLIRWRDNGGAFQTYAAPIALAEGSHVLAYQGQDRVQNVETMRSTTVLVDATAPHSAFQIGTPAFTDASGTRYIAPTTPVTFSAEDPALPGGAAGAGVERIEVAVDGGAFAPYTAALTFPEGRHTVQFRAIDRVGNVETAQPLALRSDASAPQTSLAAVGGRQAAGPDAATFYASGDSRYILPASDPVASDVASGVDFTRWRDGSGTFQTYSNPVALAEGAHQLTYQSQDRVSNLEILRSTTVLVDSSAPRSAFAIGAPSFVAPDGTRYVTPATPVTFSAQDSALPGGTAGSGVDRIEVAVDGAAFTLYTAALTFAEGRHTVQFRAVDRVGNSEVPQTLALRSDATPPQTAFSPSAPYYSDAGRDYAPAQFTYTLPASDPLTSDVASGLAETTFGIDAAPRHAYTGAFSLGEGIRTVSFGSRDNVSNLEGERSATVHVDATAPQTSLAVSGGRQAPGPDAASFYASLDTRLSLPARDPSVAGVASGLDSTSWQDNGGAFQAFGAPIALGAGSHLLSYRSQDHVGNMEVLHSTTVLVDAAAPVTAFQIGSPAFMAADGTRYLTPTTPVTFSAADPALAGGTAGSGVARIEVSVDGAPYSTYTNALTFAEGRHVIQFRAVDRVGNVEAAQNLALHSDATAPETSLAVQGGKRVAGPGPATFYASLDTRFALPAADPIVSDVAAGVDVTRWRDNGGALQAYGSPIALAEGSHLLAYQSQDNVQNLEVLRSTTILVDATAPLTAFSIGAPAYTDAAGVHYITPTTPVTFTAQDPALPGGIAGSGVERIEVALDGADFQTYSAALTFAEGRHSIRFRAYDKVGNLEAERTLEVRSDASAPLSSLAVQGGRQTAGPDAASQYASADTRIALSASDPLVAAVASGVDLIRWRDNGGAFQTYAAPIAFAEGSHVLTYQGQDKVQNVETLRSTTVMVDATAPHTAFQIGTPAFIEPSGTRYITPTTPITFSAQDPGLPGGAAGAGVERIEVAVDGGAFTAYAAALTFPEGRHTVQFRAIDRVGNVEAAQTLALRSDASAPLTTLDIQGGRQAAGPDAAAFYASSATRYALPATDPVVADVASGVEFTRWQDNGGALMSYSSTIAFPEGAHILTYASEDRVRNAEAQKGVTALVDATPPVTQLSLSGPRYAHAAGDQSVGGELFVSPTTVVQLASLDPVANGVASGLERLLASADGGPFLPWSGALSFASEGTHGVAYRAADRVGNEEGTRSLSLSVDATPPSTLLSFDGPALVRGPGTTWEPPQAEAFITPATKVILTTNDPASAGLASGVKLTRYRIDSGPWQVYGGFFYLSNQGLHLVEFAAEDRVGNVEALVAKRVAVDNTAPVVSAAINGAWLDAFGLNLLSTAAAVSLAANDSPAAGVAVGLARILYRIDDGGLLEYAAPFAMGPGSHTVRYQAVDLLGNTGAPQTLAVRVLRFLGGSLAATGAIDGSGTGDVSGLLQTNGGLSLTGNFAATGGAEAFSISLKGGAALTGPVTQGVRPLLSDGVDLAAIQAALGTANDNAALPSGAVSGGVLRLNSGQTVTLATGSYLLSGIDISGGAKLLTAGPVRIFVTGSVKLGGNAALNEAGAARNLVIFGPGPAVDLNSVGASAIIYMPSAALSLSGGVRLGGSALAASVTLAGNSNATAPGLDAPAPAAAAPGAGKGGKLAFASVGGGVGVAAGADASFVLHEVYAFPNPAVGGARPTLHVAVGVADRVTIRIYDISGQQVHQATLDSPPAVIDDGSGPKFAYEMPWDGHIPSGVYLYTVVAEKNGQGAIRKTGKFAVVR